ncbi:hypothetical protein Tel_00480 [Candidatus Tenderia electrophaga]|jgi:H+/Cl- antiporter ClcA|uniref:Uncharacterized protein n=1 Tax=Candidatus Tenderia electrophaga TaxID=1748243 RepID=A0A0S2T9A7_9GAMM|nr:hypothetical protein Tel_00480 [Candidatus Tenderia electrophaga]
MKRILAGWIGISVLTLFTPEAMADTYRYMHVTIDTPWMIFVFLLFAVLSPFILMAILYWHNAVRKSREEDARGEE